MLRVRFSTTAANDVRLAFHWYEACRPGLGEQFLMELDDAATKISRLPEAYQCVVRKIRAVSLSRFPYRAFYEPQGDVLVVLAVLHEHADAAAQFPGEEGA